MPPLMPANDDLQALTAEWVQALADDMGVTPARLARVARVSQSSMSRILRGESRELSSRTLSNLAEISTIPVPHPIRKKLERDTTSVLEQDVNRASQEASIPVWGVHPASLDGEFRLNPVPIQFLRRPPSIRASQRLMAFFAPDETMAPRWEAGEPVVVDLVRPASVGQVALITLAAPEPRPNETETYLFRRYEGRGDGRMRVAALRENTQDVIPLTRVLEVRRVLSWADVLD